MVASISFTPLCRKSIPCPNRGIWSTGCGRTQEKEEIANIELSTSNIEQISTLNVRHLISSIAQNLEVWDALKILCIARNDREAMGQARRTDPQVVCADQFALRLQLTKSYAKFPRNARGRFQNPKCLNEA